MSERKYPVITISREFGAGGHSIARVVSERLGIPYYDRDFAKQAAARSGYSQEDIDREGENLSRSARLLDNILNNSAGYFSSHDAIYQAQKELILQFAAEQDCIIIGRCSNLILRNAGIPSLDIFLHADVNLRTEHIPKPIQNMSLALITIMTCVWIPEPLDTITVLRLSLHLQNSRG